MNKFFILIICLLSVSCNKQPESTPKVVSTPMDYPRKSTRMTTVQHDGRWFLVLGEHFTHHIDCPCKKALENE